jgi:large subunit ribosomal protein L24
MAARIRKNDLVFVRSGDDKGRTGKVLRLVGEDRVVVEGVNVVWKHLKPTQQAQRGGRVRRETAIHISKVQPVDPKTGKGARVKMKIENGEKRRVAAKSGTDLGVVSKA